MMILLVQLFGALLGFTGILLGAFGAHWLRKKLPPDALDSFETGVRYQLFHAILLLVLGFNLGFNSGLEIFISTCILLGIVLFSFSIYGLVLGKLKGRKLKFLGPVTPLGGLLLLAGWGGLVYHFIAHLI